MPPTCWEGPGRGGRFKSASRITLDEAGIEAVSSAIDSKCSECERKLEFMSRVEANVTGRLNAFLLRERFNFHVVLRVYRT